MRKIMAFLIFILVMTGCSVSTVDYTPSSEQEKEQNKVLPEGQGQDVSLEDKLDKITVSNLDHNIVEIDLNLPEGYSVAFADKVGENLIAGIGESRNIIDSMGNQNYIVSSSLLKYDLQNGTHELLYHGDTYTDHFYSRLKVLQNGDIAFFASTKVLFLEKDSLRLLAVKDLPENCYFHYDISPDGSKIVINNFENGDLSITDWNFLNWKSLVSCVNGKWPGCPVWSNDGTRIAYVMFLYESSEGVGVVDIEGNGNQLFSKDDPYFIPSYAYWLNDDQSILAVQVGGKPQVYQITLSDGRFRKLEVPEPLEGFIPNPVKAKAVYKVKNQIHLMDLESGTSEILTPVQDWVAGVQWDDTGEELIVVRNNKIRMIGLES